MTKKIAPLKRQENHMTCLQNKMTAEMILNSKRAQETKRMVVRGKRDK